MLCLTYQTLNLVCFAPIKCDHNSWLSFADKNEWVKQEKQQHISDDNVSPLQHQVA